MAISVCPAARTNGRNLLRTVWRLGVPDRSTGPRPMKGAPSAHSCVLAGGRSEGALWGPLFKDPSPVPEGSALMA